MNVPARYHAFLRNRLQDIGRGSETMTMKCDAFRTPAFFLSLSVLLCSTSPGCAQTSAPPRYIIQRVVDGSVLGGVANYFSPVDINDKGDVLFSGNNGINEKHTYFRSLIVRVNGILVPLLPLPGHAFAKPLHFLPDGTVFGASVEDFSSANGVHSGVDHPVIWRASEPDALPFPQTVGGTILRRLPSGDLALSGVTDTKRRYVSPMVPVILRSDGAYVQWPLPAGCPNAYLLTSSPAGIVTGGTIPSSTSSSGNNPFGPRSLMPLIWRDGEVQTMSSVVGYRITGKFLVNDRGQVLAFTNPGPDENLKDRKRHAGTIFWIRPDAPRIVPRLSADSVTRLWALNEGGDAVGGAYYSPGIARAVLYSNGKLWDLNALMVNHPGIDLAEGRAIGNRGQIVVATIKKEKIDTFYLLAPLPSTQW